MGMGGCAMGGWWATWNGQRTVAGRFHFHFSNNSSPPPSEQLFNSQAAAAVEGGPCSTCAKSFELYLRKKENWKVTYCEKIPLAPRRQRGREKCSETPFETGKAQRFSANLRTPRYVMSSEVKQLDFVFTCKHFTCWKYGISNDLSVSNIPHKAAVILKFKWNRTSGQE